jgi:hypothetical protein
LDLSLTVYPSVKNDCALNKDCPGMLSHPGIKESKWMKVFYQIASTETGTVVLRNRKIAKALRWWLRENGHTYRHLFFLN